MLTGQQTTIRAASVDDSDGTDFEAGHDDDDDLECIWLKDSDVSWLENWWSRKVDVDEVTQNVKSRISQRVRSKAGQVGVSHGKELTESSVLYKQLNPFPDVPVVSIGQFVTDEQNSRDFFEVTLHAPQGLGMNLSVTMDGTVFVQALNRLSNYELSPAQICGVIRVGDELIGINGESLEGRDFEQVGDALRTLERLGKESVRLRFRYGDTNVVRASVANDGQNELGGDDEITAYYHQGQNTAALRSFSRSYDADDLFQSDVGVSPVEPTTRGGGSVLAVRGSNNEMNTGPVNQQINDIYSIGDIINDNNASNSSSLFQDSFVELLLQSDMGGAYGYTGSEEGRLHLLQLQQLLSAGPAVVTAEMVQNDIRGRHVYPTAARVACMSNRVDEQRQLKELAEEVFEWRPYHLFAVNCGFYSQPGMSRLLRAPPDTARYRFTQHLEWSADEQCYVAVSARFDDGLDNSEVRQAVKQGRRKFTKAMRSLSRSVAGLERGLEEMLNLKASGLWRRAGSGARLSTSLSSSSVFRSSRSVEQQTSPVLATEDSEDHAYADLNIRTLTAQSGVKLLSATHSTTHSPAQQISPAIAHRIRSTYHVIAPSHDEVRNLLRCDSDTVIRQLLHSLDHNYEEYKTFAMLSGDVGRDDADAAGDGGDSDAHAHAGCRNSSLPTPPRHYETGLEVHLPPFDITYLIFYAILYKLTPILLTDDQIITVLRKWLLLFCPDSILQAKSTHATVRSAPPTVRAGGLGAATTASRSDFLIYYNDTLSTVTNIKGYLEVISDLLTLYFLLNTSRAHLSIVDSRSSSSWSEQANESPIISSNAMAKRKNARKMSADLTATQSATTSATNYCSMLCLPVTVEYTKYNPVTEEADTDTEMCHQQWDDKAASAFVIEYRELLQLDIAAAACCARGLSISLEYVLAVTASNESFVDASVLFKELVARTSSGGRSSSVSASARYIVERCQDSVHQEFNLMFCLFLRHAAYVFRTNDQLATELCVLLAPHCTPWAVRYFIFGEALHSEIFVPMQRLFRESTLQAQPQPLSGSSATENRRESRGSGAAPSVDPQWMLAAHTKYLRYQTRVMSVEGSGIKTFRRDSKLVDEWLQSSLYCDVLQQLVVAARQSCSDDGNSMAGTEESTMPCDPSFQFTAHSILTAPIDVCSHDLFRCIELCCEYRYFEGVLVFARRWLHRHCTAELLLRREMMRRASSKRQQSATTDDGADGSGQTRSSERWSALSGSPALLERLSALLVGALQSLWLRLVEPATVLLNAAQGAELCCPTFSPVVHSQACELVELLNTALHCAELRQFLGAAGDTAVISALNKLAVSDSAACHGIENRVLVRFVNLVSPTVQHVFDYVLRKFGASTSSASSSSGGSDGRERRSRSHSRRPSNSSVVSATSFSSTVSSSGLSPVSQYRERDMLVNIACELSTVFVQSLGLEHGLAVTHAVPSLSKHVTDRYFLGLHKQLAVAGH